MTITHRNPSLTAWARRVQNRQTLRRLEPKPLNKTFTHTFLKSQGWLSRDTQLSDRHVVVISFKNMSNNLSQKGSVNRFLILTLLWKQMSNNDSYLQKEAEDSNKKLQFISRQ
jgi:hypothetical protein